MASECNFLEIYNLLFAGKTLQMTFISKVAAESFRVSLARFKIGYERTLEAVDLLEVKETLSFRVAKQEEPDLLDGFVVTWLATFKFVPRRELVKFSIVVVGEEDSDDAP